MEKTDCEHKFNSKGYCEKCGIDAFGRVESSTHDRMKVRQIFEILEKLEEKAS